MKRLRAIGIGAGSPDLVTMEAVQALNDVDVFFVVEKGKTAADLAALRKEVCARHITGDAYRVVEIEDPPRDRASPDYVDAVAVWDAQRAAAYRRAIDSELGDGQTGAFLVWGDPSIYDGTLRIFEDLARAGDIAYDVVPGVSSIAVLAARHRITLNQIGGAVLITTGRRLAATGWPAGVDDIVVMLDGELAFQSVPTAGVEIFWGAYLATPEELLVAGPLAKVTDEIATTRADARRRKGWVFDTYLLRRHSSR